MSAIRPDIPMTAPSATPATGQARSAQASFFRAALGEAQAAQSGPPAVPAGQAAASEAPRSMRPGALLDIRV